VNCQNYFSDGLIALAKYAGLKAIHASTDYAPVGATMAWHSLSQDSMLVATKPADWQSNSLDILNYVCEPADLEKMATGLVPSGYFTAILWREWNLFLAFMQLLYGKLKKKKSC